MGDVVGVGDDEDVVVKYGVWAIFYDVDAIVERS